MELTPDQEVNRHQQGSTRIRQDWVYLNGAYRKATSTVQLEPRYLFLDGFQEGSGAQVDREIEMSVGQKVGYLRVSSGTQSTERQLDSLTLDRIFEEKASGKDQLRPVLQEMLRFVREGDQLFVHSMDRLARNLSDLLKIVTDLTSKGVRVTFVKESLTFTGDDEPMAKLMLSIMGGVAEFERSMIRSRQAEGIALAKAKGNVYKGRKPSLNPTQAEQLRCRAQAGEKKAALAREFKISRETLYSYLRATE